MDLTTMDDVNCGNFYDQIDDLIDYPLDNDCSNGGHVSSGDCKTFPSIWDGALPNAAEPLLLGTNDNLASDLPAEISAPNEDILQLEWLSTFMEDSFSGGGMPLTMDIIKKIPLGPLDIVKQNYNGTQAVRRCQHCAITKTPQWRTGPMGPRTLCNACGVRYNSGRLFPEYRPAASPTFVPPLHSNSHRKAIKTRNKLVEEKSVDVTQRTRTKRRRSATFCPCMSVHLTSPNPLSHENHLIVLSGIYSESGSVGESENGKKYHNPKAMEEKTKKIPLGPMDIKQNYNGTQAVRKCKHCAVTKTPQWRNGPMGPKTLCNACGVRYRSGRLFPEYRPAASPTFVPCLHSNSYRKVLEMRNKLVEEKSVDVTQHAWTKRPRSATFSPRASVQVTSPNPPSHENNLIVLSGSSSESGSVGESENGKKYHNPQAMEEKMKKLIAPKIPLGPVDTKQNNNWTRAIRSCQHCAKTKTPQWRNGPLGPRTLCNACGVCYKSGRLLPEYPPAASPTFVPPLHSNAPRKVIEMRNKLVEEKSVDVTQSARTKRPRSATFSPCTSVQLTSPNPPSHENNLIVLSGSSSESESVGESENGKKYHNLQALEEKMKKMIAPKIPLGPMDIKQNNNGTQAVRRCQHCAITKTPQWRNGPMGPKTLCNACGFRYKSGRLLPEYRPAASPTFVPYLHSNSHRKLIGMRNKLDEEKLVDVAVRDTSFLI